MPPDGRANSWVIDNNLIWIKPMRSVYKGDSPGNGQIIKWEKTYPERAPRLVFKNNIVRVGKRPFQTGSTGDSFYFPPGMEFSNNTLVWDGVGSPPAELTNLFNAAHGSRILGLDAWNQVVEKWKAAHPDVK